MSEKWRPTVGPAVSTLERRSWFPTPHWERLCILFTNEPSSNRHQRPTSAWNLGIIWSPLSFSFARESNFICNRTADMKAEKWSWLRGAARAYWRAQASWLWRLTLALTSNIYLLQFHQIQKDNKNPTYRGYSEFCKNLQISIFLFKMGEFSQICQFAKILRFRKFCQIYLFSQTFAILFISEMLKILYILNIWLN